MDVQTDPLVEYLIGNFEKLPSDVLGLLIGQLNPQDALNLCSSNKKFYKICKSIKALEKQALQFTAHEAPLGKPINGPADYADLIRRGFKVLYTFDPREEEVFVPRENVKFGLGFGVPFEIVGLPPPRGTRVWLFVEMDQSFPDTIVHVYPSKEDLAEEWYSKTNPDMKRANARVLEMYWTNDEEMPSEEELLEDLLGGGDLYGFRAFEVELP